MLVPETNSNRFRAVRPRFAELRALRGAASAAFVLAVLGLAGATAEASGYLWISPTELAAAPTDGPAWDSLLEYAQSSIQPDLSDQESESDVRTLAAALVYARTGDTSMRTKARNAILGVIGTEDGSDNPLGASRNLTSFVIAAQLVDLEPTDESAFRHWLESDLMEQSLGSRTIVEAHEQRPNNWGTHAGAARLAVALYLGDISEVQRCAQIFKGWLGDRDSYAEFNYGDLSWQADPAEPVGINPVGSTIEGHDVDGVVPDDQRRGGSFSWPPRKVNYVYGALQGVIAQAVMFSRAGYTDVWQWEDQAILRAYRWLYDVADYPADEDDTFQMPLVDYHYGTDFWDGSVTEPGKAVGFTDYTHAVYVAPADIDVTPGSHVFGDVNVGATETQDFEVRNRGERDLHVTSLSLAGEDPGEFRVSGASTPFILRAGRIQSVSVTFEPTAEVFRRATLLVSSNDPDEGQASVTLAGNEGFRRPRIRIDPASHDYGAVVVQSASFRTFEIHNDGDANLHVSSLVVEGENTDDFAVTSGEAPLTLEPGESAQIEVRCRPASSGTKRATLVVNSDDPDEGVLEALLSAQGVVIEPDIRVNPLSYDFGIVAPGDTTWQIFQVHNEGNSNLHVSGTILAGSNAADFSIASGAAPFTVGPLQTRYVAVSFHPDQSGQRTATLSIVSNDPDELLTAVSLSGTAVLVAPDLVVAPGRHDFGHRQLGETFVHTFELQNAGSADLSVSGAFLVGPSSGEFAIDTGEPPYVLVPGASRELVVSFTPLASGDKTARLEIVSNDSKEPLVVVALDASAHVPHPEIAVVPRAHDFGNAEVGRFETKTFRVWNEGHATLQIIGSLLSGPDAAEFRIVRGSAPLSIAPGQFHELVVSFRPQAAGEKTALLRLVTNDATSILRDVPLAGTAIVLVSDAALAPDFPGSDRASADPTGSEAPDSPASNDGRAGPSAISIVDPELFRSEPNPVVTTTKLRFSLPRREHVELKVFDVHGRAVARLASRSFGAGTQEVAWDRRDVRGRRVPGGVYFARLQTTTFARTLKVIVTR